MGLELQGEYDWLGGDRLVTVIGANGTIRNIESRIDSTDASNGQLVAVDGGYFATEVVGGAYVQQRWRPFSVLHLNAGTRFDSDPRGGNRLSPRAAAVVDVWHGGELKAIYAEGFRAPSAYEAYSGGSATPNLRAETVRNAEMSFEQRLGRHKLLVGVFRQWFEHMLVLVEPDASTSFYANAEHIDTYGYNARIEGKFGALHYAGSITGAYTREHEPDGTTPLPASPQLFGNARVSYKLPGTLPTIAFASTFVGQRPADRAFDGNFSTTPYAPASRGPPADRLAVDLGGAGPLVSDRSFAHDGENDAVRHRSESVLLRRRPGARSGRPRAHQSLHHVRDAALRPAAMNRVGCSRWLALLLAVSLLLTERESRGDGGAPISLQVQLIARLAAFDRNFAARAGKVANVLVVKKTGSSEAAAESATLVKAISDLKDIGGLPLKVEQAEYADAKSVADKVRADKIAIVFFTAGLEGDMGNVATALSGSDVISVGTTAKHAENGAVVGIGVEEARPKLVLNLKRAKAQNVSFKAEILKLARIIE